MMTYFICSVTVRLYYRNHINDSDEHHNDEHDQQNGLHNGFLSNENSVNKIENPKLRIRKDVMTLNKKEKRILTKALKQAMKKKNNGMMYMDLANYHGAPYTLCFYPGCCPHGTRKFLTWHRLYTGL